MFIPASTFFNLLASDERVFLLVRHGERRHITPEDPDFGAHVGLTERGREQALSLGKCIPAEGGMSFFSSPVGRCVETALNIGHGRGIQNPSIQKMDCLAEYFVQDYDEYTKVLRAGFYEGICEWLKNEAAGGPRRAREAFAPLAARSEEMLSMMLEKGDARFNIFATHDAWIVPCLTHFCKMQFSPKRWMNYLTGMAVVTDAQKNVKRIEPVTGLDTGWLSF